MCVLLIDDFKHLLLREAKVLKTCRESKFLGEKIWRNLKKSTSYEEKKGERYLWENVYFCMIIFSCLSSEKQSLRFLLNCFLWEIKGFYQSSLGNDVDFRDKMNVSPNILAENENFKKLKQGFVDERALITTTLISSCHWKNLVPFCLRRERLQNAF